jgi:predicted dehydrogenase
MHNQLDIAIIGPGYWGINYIRVFNELPEANVAIVCDQSPDRLDEVSRRFPGLTLTTAVQSALIRENVDAVVLCTPASAHYEVARRSLEAGKHLLVEKPITTRACEAEELINLAESQGVTLMVGHTFLYNSGVRKAKDYLGQDDSGRVYYVYSRRTNLGPFRKDVNALWDLAPHDVSIFNYLLDSQPRWVSATGSNVLENGHEDVGFVTLGYDDDVVGHIHVSWADPNKVREVVVVSSGRRIVFDDMNSMEQVRVYEKGVAPAAAEASSFGEYHFSVRDGDIISPRVEVSEPLKNQCLHFLECIVEGKRPLTDGQAGLEVVKVMEAIDRSVENHGTPVEIN